MSSEAAGANRFYSGSGKYLSPLERKRLRAIQNELPEADQHKPSTRVTRARTPKPQSRVEQASKKRKRSAASSSSGVTIARPRKRKRVPKTPASEKKEQKGHVMPLSDGTPNPPPPSDENCSSAPPTTKVRKFFSSGLRFPTDGGGTLAVAATVSWNKKFKLQFKPAVASVKKPAAPIKREVLMTVPYRVHLKQAKVAPVPNVNLAVSEPKFAGTPQAGDASKTGAAAQLEKKQCEDGNRSNAVASGCIGDVKTPGGLGKGQNDSVSERLVRVKSWLSKADSAGVASNDPPRIGDSVNKNDTHLDRCVTDPWDEFDDRQPVESGEQLGKNTRRGLFTSNLDAQPEHESDSATLDTVSLASSGNGDASEHLATPDTVSRASSVNGDASEHSFALKEDSHTSNALPSAESSQALKRPETPPPSKSRSAEGKTLYPIFSTPSSTQEKSLLRRIPTSPIQMPKKFIAATSDPSQLIIDAGQKKFGHTTCSTCGMVYAVGDVDDEKLHMKHHQSFLAVVKFAGWKNQRDVGLYPDGKVVMVSHNDPKFMLKKMEEIQQMVDRELGIVENASSERVPHMFFVFVSYTKKVLGFLAAREIKQGYRVIPDDSGRLTNSYCCESNPVPAICGVSRIWTAPYYRRKKVASRLLDRMRMNFSFGFVIGLGQIAFSDPTLVGRELAASYTKNDRFLVFGP
ncbi:establishment of cohesion [Haemaphysalis longicornis]